MGRAKPQYQLFPAGVAIAWDRKPAHLTTLELFRVAAWKSAKSLALLTLNTETAIAERTAAGDARRRALARPFHGWTRRRCGLGRLA